MVIDYLQDLECALDEGAEWFACPGVSQNEWHLSRSIDELRTKAQSTANQQHHQVHIYRLVNQAYAAIGDSFLFVRRILEPSPRGEPRIHWSLADTREAAELMRDVSEGPSPYFGATVCESF